MHHLATIACYKTAAETKLRIQVSLLCLLQFCKKNAKNYPAGFETGCAVSSTCIDIHKLYGLTTVFDALRGLSISRKLIFRLTRASARSGLIRNASE